MEGFREAVEEYGFVDLSFIGLPYTWDNRQSDATNIKCRLDRGFATTGFLNIFPSIKVWHVQTMEFDHYCLVLECGKDVNRRKRRQRAFHYENMWRRDPTYRRVVEETWSSLNNPVDMRELSMKLGTVTSILKEWDRSTFGSVRQELRRLQQELEEVSGSSLYSGPTRRERHLMSQRGGIRTLHFFSLSQKSVHTSIGSRP
jgi:hypothetical protein